MENLLWLQSLFQGVGVSLMALLGSAVEIASDGLVGRTLINPERFATSVEKVAPRRVGYLGMSAVGGAQAQLTGVPGLQPATFNTVLGYAQGDFHYV